MLQEAGGLGTCQALEKEYLRLTSLPRASDVRPPEVLAAAMRLVKAKWRQEADYTYASTQLKSIRQASNRLCTRTPPPPGPADPALCGLVDVVRDSRRGSA